MSLVWTLIIGWLVISGFIGFVLMGIDKARARKGSWRVPERIFFRFALVGGVFGIVVGSSIFHHKTLKGSFIGVVLIIAIVWVVAWSDCKNFSAHRSDSPSGDAVNLCQRR